MAGAARRRLPAVVVLVVGLLALALPWLERLRPPPLAARADWEYPVTSRADGGQGSLREAITAANSAPGRARIRLPDGGIHVETPLPPLINPAGIVLQGGRGSEVEGRALGKAAVLDVIAPDSVLRGFRIVGGAGQGLLVRSARVEVDGVELRDCGSGIHALSTADGLTVTSGRFESNVVGILLEGGVPGVRIVDGSFRGHQRAGVWAVAAEPRRGASLFVRHNRFDGDDIAVVAMNVGALIEENQIAGFHEAGVFVSGGENVLRGNRIRAGDSYGICAVASEATRIEANEADHNRAVGILLKNALTTMVTSNRVYANGFGIVVVFGDSLRPSRLTDNLVWQQTFDGIYVIGGSPVVSSNQIRASGGAGIRIDDFHGRSGPVRMAHPLVTDNVVERNHADGLARGRYIE